jgi:hypothetical protein
LRNTFSKRKKRKKKDTSRSGNLKMTPYLPAHIMHAPGPGAFLTLKASKPLKIGNGKVGVSIFGSVRFLSKKLTKIKF